MTKQYITDCCFGAWNAVWEATHIVTVHLHSANSLQYFELYQDIVFPGNRDRTFSVREIDIPNQTVTLHEKVHAGSNGSVYR